LKTRRRVAAVLGGLAVVAVAIGAWAWAYAQSEPERSLERAEAAARAGDWSEAVAAWRRVNASRLARGRTHLAEARACLALGRAAQAEQALRRAVAADRSSTEAWRLRLELLRVEDRAAEAERLGWEAYAAVDPQARRGVLGVLTLTLLADLPEETARALLDRWVAADPADTDARVARLRRAAALPQGEDLDRPARIAELSAILARDPNHHAARAALAADLADAGDPERGRRVLEAWPATARSDPAYWRLLGRWQLDYDRQPAAAVASLERVVAALPHDWKTHYRLARALQAAGRPAEARREAQTVERLREVLDPNALGPRLDIDLARLDDPAALRDLADLCRRAGLQRLAQAWLRAAAAPLGQREVGPVDPL
jgi:thioredoxin-like negative regulator of GroEL